MRYQGEWRKGGGLAAFFRMQHPVHDGHARRERVTCVSVIGSTGIHCETNFLLNFFLFLDEKLIKKLIDSPI